MSRSCDPSPSGVTDSDTFDLPRCPDWEVAAFADR